MAKQRRGVQATTGTPKPNRTVHLQFLSNRSVHLVTDKGPIEILAGAVSPSQVGWKALGLSVIPNEWTPPFFVISARCYEEKMPRNTINDCSTDLQSQLAFAPESPIMIRSSGTAETMLDRGSLISELFTSADVSGAIEQLREKTPASARPQVHWIVQQAVDPKRKGHLSNERHVSREPRDWVVELEATDDRPESTIPIGIRNWREGGMPPSQDLSCASETEIPLRLRRVAKWALQFSQRIHFEWVWDGRRLWIVQADGAEHAEGIDPTTLLPLKISTVKIGRLRVFRSANANDYQGYGKLRNAALYKQFGYEMPPFYLVDDRSTIADVLSGVISPELEQDLEELLKRPLIIRTDGANIPHERREMLPRSDQLATSDEAKQWLLNGFRVKVSELNIGSHDLCLIAHHFIPSVASAWARAEPGNRSVRIESLWGIPEGLYWYSHDTFEVDTREVEFRHSRDFTGLPFVATERLRYKGTFVTASELGKWAPVSVRPPHDWRLSIKKKEWLFEIAHTTRRVAEAMNEPTSLMWFVDNHSEATRHKVLPWYHSKSELPGTPRAAPRRKHTTSRDFSIKSDADWHTLQNRLLAGDRIERIIVEPSDAAIIRNPTFARELAELSATHKFVIELYGGILSHAYYLLIKSGAKVECIDLFGVDEDQVDYNKIVRDKIPDIIERRGERAKIIRLQGEALIKALRQKLVEEAIEALDASSGEDLVGELADVSEVIAGLCNALNVPVVHLRSVQKDKRQKRGGFQEGIMLSRTTSPHSIHPTSPTPTEEGELHLVVESPPSQVIMNPADLPETPLYRRPDLRQVGKQVEKLFAFATETNKLDNLKETLDFTLPIIPGAEQPFTLTVELRRSGGTLRGTIRLRLVPLQLPINFPEDSG